MPTPRPLLLALLAATGCAGTGEGLDRYGRPIDTAADTAVDPYEGTQQILTARCVKCHDGPGSPKGLDLSEPGSYDRIVGVPSKEVPQMLLVAPELPEDSYLWAKVAPEHDARVGSRMPRDGPPYLDDFELGEIEGWIAEGALREEPE